MNTSIASMVASQMGRLDYQMKQIGNEITILLPEYNNIPKGVELNMYQQRLVIKMKRKQQRYRQLDRRFERLYHKYYPQSISMMVKSIVIN